MLWRLADLLKQFLLPESSCFSIKRSSIIHDCLFSNNGPSWFGVCRTTAFLYRGRGIGITRTTRVGGIPTRCGRLCGNVIHNCIMTHDNGSCRINIRTTSRTFYGGGVDGYFARCGIVAKICGRHI